LERERLEGPSRRAVKAEEPTFRPQINAVSRAIAARGPEEDFLERQKAFQEKKEARRLRAEQ